MRKWKIFALSCIIATIFCGCGVAEKTEEEIKTDLSEHKNFFSAQMVEITDFEIIKRQTDEKAKEDIVYVQVSAENTDISCQLSYCLQYGLYDEGWILDDVTIYDEGVTKVVPKTEVEQTLVDSDVRNITGYDFIFEDKVVDLGNGSCEYIYGYTTKDGCASVKFYPAYRFNEETAEWEMISKQQEVTLLAEVPQAVADAKMKEFAGRDCVIADKIVDLENGTCRLWYEYVEEQTLQITRTRYWMDYSYDTEILSWISVNAGAENSTKELNQQIEGLWWAIHSEKDNVWGAGKYSDRYYWLEVSNVTDSGFAMKLYRDDQLVIEKSDCKLIDGNYDINAKSDYYGVDMLVANLYLDPDGFCFKKNGKVEVVFQKIVTE